MLSIPPLIYLSGVSSLLSVSIAGGRSTRIRDFVSTLSKWIPHLEVLGSVLVPTRW